MPSQLSIKSRESTARLQRQCRGRGAQPGPRQGRGWGSRGADLGGARRAPAARGSQEEPAVPRQEVAASWVPSALPQALHASGAAGQPGGGWTRLCPQTPPPKMPAAPERLLEEGQLNGGEGGGGTALPPLLGSCLLWRHHHWHYHVPGTAPTPLLFPPMFTCSLQSHLKVEGCSCCCAPVESAMLLTAGSGSCISWGLKPK